MNEATQTGSNVENKRSIGIELQAYALADFLTALSERAKTELSMPSIPNSTKETGSSFGNRVG